MFAVMALQEYDKAIQLCHETRAANFINEMVQKWTGALDASTTGVQLSVTSAASSDLPTRTRLILSRTNFSQSAATPLFIYGGLIYIFCTVMSTEKPELANMLFPLQLCDEAAQVAELSSLVALRKGVKVLCLVGDHEQLPPHVTSKLAKTAGMSTSLFERWAKSQVTPTVRLLSGKEFSEVLIDEKVHNLQRCACWHLLAAAASVES